MRLMNIQRAVQAVNVVGSASGVNIHVACVPMAGLVTLSRLRATVRRDIWDRHATIPALRYLS